MHYSFFPLKEACPWNGIIAFVLFPCSGFLSFFLCWYHLDFFFFFLAMLCCLWDLISLARDRSRSPCFGRRNLNHWAVREVPGSHTLKNLSGCSLPWGSPPITKATLGTDALLWNLLEQLGGAGLSSLLRSLTWLPPIHPGHWRECAFASRTLLLAGSCGLSSPCFRLQPQETLGLCLSPFLLHQELQPHVHSKCCKGSIGSARVSSASPCRGTEAGRFP